MSRVFRSGNTAPGVSPGGAAPRPLGCGVRAGPTLAGMVRDVQPPSQERVRGASLGLPADGPGVAGELQHAGSAPSSSTRSASALVAGLFTAPELPGNWSLVAFARRHGASRSSPSGRRRACGCSGLRLAHPRPGQRLALWRAVVRTALLCLLVPGAARRRRRPRPARPAHRHRRRHDVIVRRSGRPTTPPGGTTAFGRPGRVDAGRRAREDAGFLPHLSLVAEDGDVVGHVIATRGWLEPLGTRCSGWDRSACTRDSARRRHRAGARLLAVAEAATSGWSPAGLPATTGASVRAAAESGHRPTRVGRALPGAH